MKVVPADVARPAVARPRPARRRWSPPPASAALVYALSQAADAGWTSAQTLGLGLAGLAGLAAFAALELHTHRPLLNISRLGERGVGGGFVMMLAASAVLFGSFLLTSIYLQDVLGAGALETGLAFLPMAVVIGLGAHLGSHLVGHAGVRIAMAVAFALTAAGMLLLAGVDARRQLRRRRPARHARRGPGTRHRAGLGRAVRAHRRRRRRGGHALRPEHDRPRDRRLARRRRPRHHRHRRHRHGPSASTAGLAGGLGDAFLVAGVIAAVAAVVALFVLPSAASFLPKLRLAPRVAIH